MNIRSVSTCINCENLSNNFHCTQHKTQVDFNTVCDSHKFNKSLTKDSSCVTCSKFNTSSCSYPDKAHEKMLCFDWEK